MKKLVSRRLLHIFHLACSIVLIVIVFGNGCSQGGFQGSDSKYNGVYDQSSLLCQSATEIKVIPGTKTVSMVGSGQLLNHLTNCIGLAVASDATQTVYNEKKSAISTYGAANTITPPMMMAITSIAGEVCSDVIDQEIATGGRIFSGLNLQASSLPADSELSTVISNIALSCWRGNETNEERNLILTSVNESVGVSEASAARKAALIICTSMLSSVNALLN